MVSYSFAQANGSLALEVYDCRPMAETVIALGEQLQCPITYEDPPFEFAGDLRPVFPGSATRVPKGGRISFSYQKTDDTLGIIRQLLAQHSAEGNAGDFTVFQTGDIFNVIPVRYKDKAGEPVEHHSVLDTRISISLQDTNFQYAIDAVCKAVSKANSRFRLDLGQTPLNAFLRMPYSREIVDEPARDVINEMLAIHNQSLKGRNVPFLFTWQVRTQPPISPQEKQSYGFSFRRISLQSPDSMKMRVASKRPMASAIQLLEKRFGNVITYEGPPYICPSDLWTVDGSVKGLVGWIINMDWDKTYSVEEVLGTLMQTRIGPRDVPAVFTVEKTASNKFHVYPLMAKDEDGNLVSRTSIMNRQVSFNAQNINGLTFIESICSKLSDLANENVVLGPVPENLSEMLRKHISPSISITNQKAHDCLGQFLWKIKAEISWQLLFDPSLKQYQLILHNSSEQKYSVFSQKVGNFAFRCPFSST
jgi:hypothetical protein